MNALRGLICFLPVVPGLLTGCATTASGTQAVDEYVEVQDATVRGTAGPARSPRERLERDPAYRNVGPGLAIALGAPRGEAANASVAVKLWQLIGR